MRDPRFTIRVQQRFRTGAAAEIGDPNVTMKFSGPLKEMQKNPSRVVEGTHERRQGRARARLDHRVRRCVEDPRRRGR
jgi:hypothetical protein